MSSSVPRDAGSARAARPLRPWQTIETMNRHVLAMWVFISSEVFFFGSLITVYLVYRGATGDGPTPAVLDVPRTALFSIFLFASSGTIVIALSRLHHNDRRGLGTWLLVTVLLGGIFLAGQFTEYLELYHEGITINRNLFTASFYTLTGFHGLHVLSGALAILVVAGLAFAGDFSPRRDTAVEAVSLYWHFVDVVWIVIFSLVYLGSLI
jgi:heme/copper-type cytochrome/quinol oxidase subunit 3